MIINDITFAHFYQCDKDIKMITSDNKYWSSINNKEIIDIAKLWSKKYTTKKLEAFIANYRSLMQKNFLMLTDEEKKG